MTEIISLDSHMYTHHWVCVVLTHLYTYSCRNWKLVIDFRDKHNLCHGRPSTSQDMHIPKFKPYIFFFWMVFFTDARQTWPLGDKVPAVILHISLWMVGCLVTCCKPTQDILCAKTVVTCLKHAALWRPLDGHNASIFMTEIISLDSHMYTHHWVCVVLTHLYTYSCRNWKLVIDFRDKHNLCHGRPSTSQDMHIPKFKPYIFFFWMVFFTDARQTWPLGDKVPAVILHISLWMVGCLVTCCKPSPS